MLTDGARRHVCGICGAPKVWLGNSDSTTVRTRICLTCDAPIGSVLAQRLDNGPGTRR
jgi:hypothetical protein